VAVIELEGARVARGRFVLDVPSLRVEAGTVVGLCGRNGVGKSTLLEVIAGLVPPSAGTVRVLGLDPQRDVVALRRRITWMSDEMPLFAVSLAEHARILARFYPTWDAAFVATLLDRFELDPARRVTELSKGEATRARLVLCLGHRPEVLLLDEPATGLDVPARRALLAQILELMQDERRVVVIASHQVDDVERIADRFLLLDAGRVVADGDLATLTGGTRTLEEVLAGGSS
jgi:ABC-2 type transport system ATP-binding protein